jgi:hypothetical protein
MTFLICSLLCVIGVGIGMVLARKMRAQQQLIEYAVLKEIKGGVFEESLEEAIEEKPLEH